LIDPYAGPGAQRVTASRRGYALSQWFADKGFAVLVTDGRGTPGRGLKWEHAIDGDLGKKPAQDQIEGLLCAASKDSRLDLNRVGVRGWSFGGYLALQLAMRYPALFKAVIAGAAVVDWEWYDTHYTERFLGLPTDNPQAYERSRVPPLPKRNRPALLLIHGLMDDNVHPANTVTLSARLLRAGWEHDTVYIPDAHHHVNDPDRLSRVLRAEVEFLRKHLLLAQRPER
jgi:dipeptidyl-peptidase-4